jgi:hypothetical protein
VDRTIDLMNVSDSDCSLSAKVIIDTLDVLVYSNDQGVESDLKLTYDMAGAGANLSTSSYFLIETEADLTGVSTLTVTDTDTNSDSSSDAFDAGFGFQAFAFSDFSGVDMSKVAQIVLDVSGPASFDANIDSITSGGLIPEPVTVLGMLFGLGGVGAYIRRRRMA